MKVYLAGAAAEQARLLQQADRFKLAGHEITSRWLDMEVGVGPVNDKSADQVLKFALDDLADVASADALVMFVPMYDSAMSGAIRQGFTMKKFHTGGRHVEVGYALGLGKTVIIVGEPENIFERTLPHVVETTGQALKVLSLSIEGMEFVSTNAMDHDREA